MLRSFVLIAVVLLEPVVPLSCCWYPSCHSHLDRLCIASAPPQFCPYSASTPVYRSMRGVDPEGRFPHKRDQHI